MLAVFGRIRAYPFAANFKEPRQVQAYRIVAQAGAQSSAVVVRQQYTKREGVDLFLLLCSY